MKKFILIIVCICFWFNRGSAQMIKKIPKGIRQLLSAGSCKYEADNGNGHVIVRLAGANTSADNIKIQSSLLNTDMCLSKEEVRGQKIENKLILINGSDNMGLVPGGIIDANLLLTSGNFVYGDRMNNRRPVSISSGSGLFNKTADKITPVGNESIESQLYEKVNYLKSSGNLINVKATPNEDNTTTVKISSSKETIGLQIGASAFYMGAAVKDNFSFSSDKYRYMYMYEFEQECISIRANSISSPADVFTDGRPMSKDYLYVSEVTYGRRLYVLIESEFDLEKYANELEGSLDWGVVGGAYSQKNTGSSLYTGTNIRIVTQGGTSVAISDTSELLAKLKHYQTKTYREFEQVPLSYKLTYLDGTPVSMISTAFLNNNNCLDKGKVRVRIKSLECVTSGDGGGEDGNNEEVYGAINIKLYTKDNKLVFTDGKTPLPAVPGAFTGSIIYGKKDSPKKLIAAAEAEDFKANQQSNYVDINISNLDMKIELLPWMKEHDDLSADDVLRTNETFKKSIRQMLLDGSSTTEFIFTEGQSKIIMIVEISPL